MAAKKKDTGLDAPIQSDEAREKVLGQVGTGGGTATGQARSHFLGDEKERIEGLESRGSTQEIAGGEPVADASGNDTQKPRGAQAQPSAFVSNGSLPVNMVASGSGPVPVSSVTSNPEDAARMAAESIKAHDDHVLRSGATKLSRAQIESMSGAELRAVASDRGYDLGEQGGNRTTRRRFIEAQNKDEVTPESEDAGDEASDTNEE